MTSITSTSLNVKWSQVPEDSRHGVITGYDLKWGRKGDPITQSVSTSTRTHELSPLDEFSEYNMSIRAKTLAGNGPWSDWISHRTDSARTGFCPRGAARGGWTLTRSPSPLTKLVRPTLLAMFFNRSPCFLYSLILDLKRFPDCGAHVAPKNVPRMQENGRLLPTPLKNFSGNPHF